MHAIYRLVVYLGFMREVDSVTKHLMNIGHLILKAHKSLCIQEQEERLEARVPSGKHVCTKEKPKLI